MSKAIDITTPQGQPDLTIMNSSDGATLLILSADGFEASLKMSADTMRDLRDELTERLAAVENKEAA